MSNIAPRETPTPIPALALVEKDGEEEGVEVDEGDCVGAEVDVAVIKSDDWYLMRMAYALTPNESTDVEVASPVGLLVV